MRVDFGIWAIRDHFYSAVSKLLLAAMTFPPARRRRLASGPAETLAHIKRATYLGATATLADALAAEEQAQAELFLSANAREGMRAFVEKRPAGPFKAR